MSNGVKLVLICIICILVAMGIGFMIDALASAGNSPPSGV